MITNDPLLQAADFWLNRQGINVPPSIYEGVVKVGPFMGLTLYRRGQLQVQIWLCPPGSEIPDHSHPNVDQIQIYVCGDMLFRINGKITFQSTDGDASVPVWGSPIPNAHGAMGRVNSTDTHGATIGPAGGSFLNIQLWKNGVEPRSVETDWVGDPVDEAHAGRILKA